MKLNKKKWFLKNIIEFEAYYTEMTKSRIVKYERWGAIGGRWTYNWDCALTCVKATVRVLCNMQNKPWEQYFYLKKACVRYNNFPKVEMTDVKFRDAL